MFVDDDVVLFKHLRQEVNFMVECSHLSRVLLPLFTSQFHGFIFRFVQIGVGLDKLIDFVSCLIQSLILFTL